MIQPIPGTTPRAWPPPQTEQQAFDLMALHTQAPAATASNEIRTADFSNTPTPIFFTIDGERYDCKPRLGPAQIQQMAGVARSGLSDIGDNPTVEQLNTVLDKLGNLFRAVMYPESAEKFIKKLRANYETPSDVPLDLYGQVIPIIHWLLEQYGMRPTQPSSASSTGSVTATTGTSSTAGAQPAT